MIAPASTTPQTVCTVRNLSFAYDKRSIFSSASLEIHSGEFLAIIGDNGTGKSTLMKLLLGTLTPQSGEITLFGDAIQKNNHYADIAYVSQNSILGYRSFPTTIRELVEVHCQYLKISHNVEDLLGKVDLKDHIDKKLSELSGGQLQRVGILVALLKDAKLILLDEPTSGIDKKFAHELFLLLRKLCDDQKTVVIITHHLHELKDVVDRVVMLEDGHMHEVDSARWKASVI